MTENKLVIGPFAEEDLKEAKEFYELQKEGLGDEFVGEVEKTIEKIIDNPLQFQKVKKDMRKVGVTRFPFGVFYVFRDSMINVLSVFHFSRNPKIWKDRFK